MSKLYFFNFFIQNIEESVLSIYRNFFFQQGLAYPLMPLAWLIGIPWQDCNKIANLLAIKFIVSDFVAYKQLTDWAKEGLVSVSTI